MNRAKDPRLTRLSVAAYRVPTEMRESDGTLAWNHTGVVIVRAAGAGVEGIGWTYAPRAAAVLVHDILAAALDGASVFAIESAWQQMRKVLRNAGTGGAGMMAISAVDAALWDLKAKALNLPLVGLLGGARQAVRIYGSGGFTSYSERKLCNQLAGWVAHGIGYVKMKVGREPKADLRRVRAVRRAIGPGAELFVDANGAYARKEALHFAAAFGTEARVSWFEEPVSADDLEGMRLIRDRGPEGMDIAAGEYGDAPGYFVRMMDSGAVDCLQADATRCGGPTGFLKVSAYCEAAHMPLSAHCAPQLHAHVGCAAPLLRHVEYFHDHVRLDQMLFDGVLSPIDGMLRPDTRRAGFGLSLRVADARRFEI